MGMFDPDMLKADGFDEAIMGTGSHFSQPVYIYDYEKCVDILCRDHGLTEEDAIEYMEFNVCGAWLGPSTPVFMRYTIEEYREDFDEST